MSVKPIPALALALTGLVLLAPLASAAEPEEDLAWRREGRVLDVRGGDNGFTFSSQRSSALSVDALSGSFDARTATFTADLVATAPVEASLGMDTTWLQVVEYRDLDGDGRYGLADETVHAIRIPGLPHQTVVTPLLSGGQTATVTYTLPANATDPDPVLGGGLPSPRGTLRLTFTFVPSGALVAGSQLQPTDIGLRMELRDFPFQAGSTRLALVAKVSTDGPAAPPIEPGEARLAVATDTHGLKAQWAPQTLADGVEAPAGWSSLSSDDQSATVVLSLPRGDVVSQGGSVSAHRWQDDVAEALRDLPPGDWRLYAAGLAGIVVALGVPSLRRLRER